MRLRDLCRSAGTRSAPKARMPSADRKRVLFVDDDEDTRETIAELIALLGHECVTAGSGAQCLAALDRFVPHVIFVDIGLPDMTGHELAAIIRKTRLPDVTIIAVSGRAAPSDVERSLEAGITMHLAKPIGCDTLRQLVGDATTTTANAATPARAPRGAAAGGAPSRVRLARGR